MSGNKHTKILRIFAVVSLVLGVLFAAVNTFCIQNYYDMSVYLFEAGVKLPKIMNILLAVYAVIALIVSLACKNSDMPDSLPKRGLAEKILGIATGVLLAVSSVIAISDAIEGKKLGFALSRSQVFLMISCAFAFVAAVYFIINSVSVANKNVSAILGLCTVVFAVFKVLSLYFDRSTHINDPIKVFEELSMIAVMIYLLVEVRYDIGVGKPHFYIGFGSLSFVVLLTSALSDSIDKFYEITLFTHEGIFALARLIMAILVGVRIIKLALNKE